ncbi:MAG TPA: multicopper oxidase domain-containing protein [Myxococcaceae bacterium]|nr:multicopper oxidase domain-containing protein [Myxococcaceae bacterium]
MRRDGSAIDPVTFDEFNCLQQTGDFCQDQNIVLRPFVQALPIPPIAQPVNALNPPPDPKAHQQYEKYLPQKLYEIHVQPFQHRFHPDLPPSTIWGYNSIHPGATYQARYGEPILVRYYNDLPLEGNDGFGKPEIITHLHNFHTASESDGFPGDFYPPGMYKDHHYAMALAGGNPDEALNTLWYHDHRVDFTSQNVYKGLAGFMEIFDERDSGDENDPNPNAFHLPSGDYDVPLVFIDRRFDATPDHQLYMDVFNLDGFLGNQYTVNGAIQPYFNVARRKYRFRLLDAGPSRFYQFALSNGQQMTLIANDGNLLPAPINVDSVRVTVAERVDIVIDFSKVPIGTEIYLLNIMDQFNGKGPTGIFLDPSAAPQLLKFVVDRDAPDPSQIPQRMREVPTIDTSEIVQTRTFVFDNQQGAWTINNEFFDFNRVSAVCKQGTAEKWILKNASFDWQHPIHIHLEEHQIVSRGGVPPPDYEQGRKDVTVLLPGQEVQVIMRFRDWLGRYPMHCHNTVHEDHAMMLRWDVEP